MQKVLRQNLLRRNQVLKNERRLDKKKFKKELHEAFQERVARERHLRDNVKAERVNRREDWMLGPLAPNRNIGDNKGKYGTISSVSVRLPPVVERWREKYVNFTPGDRVVVVRGRHRGKIGMIKIVDETRNSVELHDLNIADVGVPEFAQKQQQQTKPYTSYTIPLPFNDVRLVIPMTDDETGEVKDVVVRHVYGGEPIIEREHGSSTPKHTRYIAGLDEEIPWPDMDLEEYEAEEDDTLRMVVEEKTFIPEMNEPLPENVIDELRDPFDRQRARHEQRHISKKMMVDIREGWKQKRRLLTPQAEYLEIKSKQKSLHRSSGAPPALDESTLQLIAQVQSMNLKATS